MIQLVTGLFGLAGTWIEGKQKKQAAKDERAAERLKQEGSWDDIHAKNAAGSWKDEYLTVIVSIPLIMCFIPYTVEYVGAGFAALEQTPDWYVYLIGLVFGASFGVKSTMKIMSAKKG